jgi:holo-[acyl-carrier protein] synthase
VIAGVGVDIVEIARIAGLLERHSDRFSRRILQEEEIRHFKHGFQEAAYIARQFAAKEAVSKALGTGMRSGVHFRNILVLRDKRGMPVVSLHDAAQERLGALGGKSVMVSISDEREYAIAYAVVCC